ncbi:ubiquinone biosynthesis UbiH/UbiF/VisC/COQ6 family hydroxylase [Sphingomonas zeicaulis]|uniref:5-demethoxyubiquinol-8 5-hydroxylase UbiM n=1 Tax=Sphingomonas zeicaulis TaxID=1632740 RepID=UPI003D1C9CDF
MFVNAATAAPAMTGGMQCDVIVVGAGPAGLAFARALEGSGLDVVLIERQPLERLKTPADDGRDIALTHRSVDALRRLGAWDHIDPAAVAPLRAAQVLDGASPFALAFDPGPATTDALGRLVANHHIRRALFAAVDGQPGPTILAGAEVAGLVTGKAGAAVTLRDGRTISARLLVGADSRFSDVRARLGIKARVDRLGRSMLLVRVAHERDHRGIATEWFDHGQTIALLPLAGRHSSVVLTLDEDEAARVAARDPEALAAELTRRSAGRLGTMTLAGTPRLCPLATVWSRDFTAPRAALIGDAAVGMHPVTAHGFNLGLRGAVALADLIQRALRRGSDIAAPLLLARYEAGHRLAAGPLFTATALIVRTFTDNRPAARIARPALLRLAHRLPVVRAGITRMLMQR